MSLSNKFSDFILKLFVPAKLVIGVLVIINTIGYAYYEPFLWIKILVTIIAVLSLYWVIYLDELKLATTLNIFLTVRNLYFIFATTFSDFIPLMIVCLVVVGAIFYFMIDFEDTLQKIHLGEHIWVYTLFGSLIITELFHLFSYWQSVPIATRAILITVVYYLLTRTIELEDEQDFNLRKLGELFIITTILVTLITISVNWIQY